MQISARVIAFVLFLLVLALNEWAFEFVLPTEREVDYFVRFLVLVTDVFFADVIAILLFFGKDLSLSQTLKKVSEMFPKLTAFYFGLFVAFVIFCCAEFGTRYYFKHFYQPPFKDVTEWKPQPTVADSLLAYRLPENKTIQHRYLVNDSLIYEQHYKIDSFSRRETPADTLTKDKFIAVAGCSFAFGYGVSDNETLPYFLQQQMPGYEGYNYGVSGYGTQHLLLQTREKINPTEIKQKQGILVYFFIDNHLNRLIGSRRIIKLWGENFPYFFLDDALPAGRQENKLQQNGTFKTGRKWKTLFYKTITNSAIVDILDLEIPFSISKDDFRLAAAVISESKKEFEKNFPCLPAGKAGSKFVVLFCPGSKCSGELAALLAKKDIDFVDYSLLFDINSKEYRSHYSDPHPNGKAYEELAKKLGEYLNP